MLPKAAKLFDQIVRKLKDGLLLVSSVAIKTSAMLDTSA
jgi:hypothetical protein